MLTKYCTRIAPFAVAAFAVLTVFAFSAPAQVPAPAQPRPPAPPARKYPLSLEPRVYDTFDQKIRVSVLAHGSGGRGVCSPFPMAISW